jgi:hypothetical protein
MDNRDGIIFYFLAKCLGMELPLEASLDTELPLNLNVSGVNSVFNVLDVYVF